MGRRRRDGRENNDFANSRVAQAAVSADLNSFGDNLLREMQENPRVRYQDLTTGQRVVLEGDGPLPRHLTFKPRVLVVPEGHPLARLAPYGARLSLRDALKRDWRRHLLDFGDRRYVRTFHMSQGMTWPVDSYGVDEQYRVHGRALPWHVMVCVRRKIRREVIFARGKGGGGHARKSAKFTPSSEVRC